jgi:ABC-2 type transport system permease protein
MRAALVIAGKDLRQRLRDRSALLMAFVAPIGIALVISFAFPDGFADSFSATYAVTDQDQSQISEAFIEVLESPELAGMVEVERASTPEEAREMVDEGRAGAAFVIPSGFFQQVLANQPANITVLLSPDAPIGSTVAEAIASAFTDQLNASRLSVATALAAGGGADPEAFAQLAAAAAEERIPVELTDGQIGVRQVSGANYFGPAMAIFFLFFTTAVAARSLITERQEGTLPRVLAAPIRRSSVIVGKALTGFVLGMASLAVMFAFFGLLLDVSWGDPLGLVVLSAFTVLAVMGVMAFALTLSRTQEQAEAYASVVAVTLAILGGSFFPIFQMPEAVQRLSLFTPNGQAIRGFTDLGFDGATLLDLGPNLFVIGVFALVTGGLAVLRSRSLN